MSSEGSAQLSCDLADLQQCLSLGQLSQEEHDDLRRQALEGFARRLQRCCRSCSGRQPGTSCCAGGSAAAQEAPAAGQAWPAQGEVPPEAPLEAQPSLHAQLSARRLRQSTTLPSEGDGIRHSESNFWCKWIRRRSVANAKQERQSLDKATVNDIIDVTAGRLDEIFDRFDSDQDGRLDIAELRAALASQGFNIDQDACTRELANHVYEMSGQAPMDKVTVREFDTMMTRLRLAELFTPHAGIFQWTQYDGPTTSPVSCCDYNHNLVQLHHNIGELPEFFFGCCRPLVEPQPTHDGKMDASLIVRWVHMDAFRGIDRLRLLRLAVKYHLHPVHMDVVLENRSPSKFECCDKYYFISVDILTLAQGDAHGKASGRVRIHRSHVSIFLSGSSDWDTLLTMHQNRPDESSWLAMWRRGKREEVVDPARDVWDAVRKAHADFLLYEVLHHIVDDLRPIADAYAQRLGFMYKGSQRRFPQAWLTELGEMELELADLSRSIRPMRPLLRHLLGDKRIGANTKIHLEDTDDAVAEMMDDISQLQQMSRYLQEAHERQHDKKMNDTLFVLSLISAIFLPAQFITGLYGMNFVDLTGKPTIPELTWENGYLWFWLWQGVALLTAVVIVYLAAVVAGHACRWLQRARDVPCVHAGIVFTHSTARQNPRISEGSWVCGCWVIFQARLGQAQEGKDCQDRQDRQDRPHRQE
eukprot:CAMPEP_0171270422 /NCGR_PEP_ID=MMETSP0790-20130122/60701_1 /TAXON_ID=2925 /ORGANISM="Alexandrium catenella, Strain OF101" /LENGTH=698 /DNA_ID=CAMNT_0011739259 /DNA_START=17 /DNA_END=2111 /DNA_ORIENTATION=+